MASDRINRPARKAALALLACALATGGAVAKTALADSQPSSGPQAVTASEAVLTPIKKVKKQFYFQQSVSNICANSFCTIPAFTVPKKHVLEIKDYSCSAILDSGGRIFYMGLAISRNGTQTAFDIAVPTLTYDGSFASYSAQRPTTLYVMAGDALSAVASTEGHSIQNFSCKISGVLDRQR